MDSCRTVGLFNDNCGEDPLSSTEIKDEPKEEPQTFPEREPKLSTIEQKQPKFKQRIEDHDDHTLLQQYHDIQLERSCTENVVSSEVDNIQPSSDTFCNETLREKCELEHPSSHSLNDACVKEKTVKNQKSELVSHNCIFTYDNSLSHQNIAVDHDIKRDFPLAQDVSVKTKFCQECNKSVYLYMCEICKRAFTDENLVESHMNSHVREHTYECEVCHKSFSAKKYLRNHVIIHTGKRPYSCNVCEKSFNHNSNLLRHMHLHSKERPFKCEYCYKTFVVKGELRFHIRTHTGERPYQCDICSKTYLRKTYLDIHMQVHISKHKYKCEVCNKTFSRRAYLYNHMYIHSGASPNSCEVCNKSFTTRSSLVRHQLNYCILKSNK